MVGAGLAGLTAAHELSRRGVAATVVEARNRVGGRVWSRRLDNGAIVEMGAEWIMPGDDALRELCRSLSIGLSDAGVDYRRREPRGPGRRRSTRSMSSWRWRRVRWRMWTAIGRRR